MSNIIYEVVEEWAAPTYYYHGTSDIAYAETQESVQALWVVSYDTEQDEVVEWLERFCIGEDDKALARAKELNEEDKE